MAPRKQRKTASKRKVGQPSVSPPTKCISELFDEEKCGGETSADSDESTSLSEKSSAVQMPTTCGLYNRQPLKFNRHRNNGDALGSDTSDSSESTHDVEKKSSCESDCSMRTPKRKRYEIVNNGKQRLIVEVSSSDDSILPRPRKERQRSKTKQKEKPKKKGNDSKKVRFDVDPKDMYRDKQNDKNKDKNKGTTPKKSRYAFNRSGLKDLERYAFGIPVDNSSKQSLDSGDQYPDGDPDRDLDPNPNQNRNPDRSRSHSPASTSSSTLLNEYRLHHAPHLARNPVCLNPKLVRLVSDVIGYERPTVVFTHLGPYRDGNERIIYKESSEESSIAPSVNTEEDDCNESDMSLESLNTLEVSASKPKLEDENDKEENSEQKTSEKAEEQ